MTLASGLFMFGSGFALLVAAVKDNARAAGIAYTAAFASIGCLLIGEFF